MSTDIFVNIPDDILETYIFPNILNNIKMLLCKKYYYMYHNYYYTFSHKYLIYIVKNKINICMDLLSDYNNFNINKKEKIYYNKKTFFLLYDFCIYIARKYNSIKYLEYFTNLYENKISENFSNLRIKQYKNYVNKNILWIK